MISPKCEHNFMISCPGCRKPITAKTKAEERLIKAVLKIKECGCLDGHINLDNAIDKVYKEREKK